MEALRFIPTYVGHTSPCVMQFGIHSVHPHLRGAYVGGAGVGAALFGSSPPTWGIQKSKPLGQTQGRFIPTYVGHTDE